MRKLVKTLLTLSLMAPAAALALGLGEIKLHSALNQTLDAEIELLSVDPAEADDIEVSLASAETFSKVGLQRPAVLMMVNFEVLRRDNGAFYVKVTSRDTIREPFLDFLVEVEWPTGKVMREYTLLLDPPVSYQAEAPAVTSPSTAEAGPVVESTPAAKPAPAAEETQAVAGADKEEQFVPPPSAIPGAAAQAPAPEPEPVVDVKKPSQEKTAPARSLNYGAVKANDTLWEIALKMRPNRNISVHQMMMALQRANPDAFINNNINLLKKGYVLRIDDPALLTAMSKAEAARQVASQTREWQDYRAAIAEKAEERQPATGAGANAGAAGASKAEPKLKLVAPDDEAREAGSAAEGEAAGGDADEELMLALENSAAQQMEKDALQGRVAELEKQLQDMKSLLALKNEDLKTLQDQLAKRGQGASQAEEPLTPTEEQEEEAEGESASAVSETETQADTNGEMPASDGDGGEEPVIPEAQEASDAQSTEEGEETAAEEAEAAEGAMEQPREKGAVTPEKPAADNEQKAGSSQSSAKPAKPEPQPAAQSNQSSSLMDYVDMLMKDPMMLAAGGGTTVLLLILALLLVRRRSKGGGFQESILSGGSSSMLNASSEELDSETSFLSDLAISGMGGGAITTDEGEVDPLTEADVFMAYGRNQQAEEVLKKALESNSDRPDIIAKLLEVYYNAGDKAQFEGLIEQSGDKVKGNDELWNKIAPMGQELIPENPMFGGTSTPAPSSAQQSAPQADDVLDIGLDLDELTSESETQTEEGDDSLDLGMELDLDEEKKPAEQDKSLDEPTDDLADLDFDIDLGDDAEDTLQENESVDAVETTEESSDLEFDFSGLETEEPEEEKSSDSAGDELADIDFGDFEVGTEDQSAEEEPGSFDLDNDEDAKSDDDSLDLGDFDFGDLEFDSGEETETASGTEAGSSTDSETLDMGDLDSVDELDDFGDLDEEGVLSDSEEMTTKLDLAQAYIEMGDNEGARGMLEEVVEGGNDEQKQQAQELLSKV
ncbi:MAG: FimV/HubP family polar landmark protein [Pseudomonadota bacterium]